MGCVQFANVGDIPTWVAKRIQHFILGVYHSSKKAYQIFKDNRIFTEFAQTFLEDKRIFAKGIRDFYRVIHPSISSSHMTQHCCQEVG